MTHNIAPTAVAIDPTNGDVVTAGYFLGSVDFGGGLQVSDPAPGATNMFLARFDASGGYLWSKNVGNGTQVIAHAVAVGASGTVFVGGSVTVGVDYGCGLLPAVGIQDVVVVAFTPAGSCAWSKRFGAPAQAQNLDSLEVDGQENVVLGGIARGGLDFGGGPRTGYYIAKLDSVGTHLWSKAFATSSTASSPVTAVDSAGNVAMTGSFTTPVDFGGGLFTPTSAVDAFLAKFGPAGDLLWAKQYGNNVYVAAHALAVGPADDLFVAVDFGGMLDFGSVAVASVGGEGNMALAKVDPTGAGVWARQFNTTSGGGTLVAKGIAVDESGGPTMGVWLRGPNFGGSGPGTVDFGGGTITSQNSTDVTLVIASFDSSGQYRWAVHGGPPSTAPFSTPGIYDGMAARGPRLVVTGRVGSGANNVTSPPGTTLMLPGETLSAGAGADAFLAVFHP